MKSAPNNQRICLTPRLSGVGGMVSFQGKLKAGLLSRGIDVTFDLDDQPYDSVLVIGGTRRLTALRRSKRMGVPIIQRLDGINWLHRQLDTGWKHWLRAEYGNWLLSFIRHRLATQIIYQSDFVQSWWQERYGEIQKNSHVIHNGVDLDLFSPEGDEKPPKTSFRLLLVEGSLLGGYELGLESAVRLAEALQQIYDLPIELCVAGLVSAKQRAHWESKSRVSIQWAGLVAHKDIPTLNRSAHVLFSADLNAACPNAVIEAMACGLPVVAFDTGALGELVTPQSGQLVPYGGDPWRLDPPDFPALAKATVKVLQNQATFRKGARARAEEAFGLDAMVTAYLESLASNHG